MNGVRIGWCIACAVTLALAAGAQEAAEPYGGTAAVAPVKLKPDANAKEGGLREGGETCATAVVIPGLPYTDSGNTSDNTNDHSGSCGGGSARDVVYRYTPATNELVTIDLCASSYDTVLYVYANACTGATLACNDDACGTRSKLTNVSLTAGTTYYIVVDGYGGASAGAYTIVITAATPPPANDNCSGALPVTDGTPAATGNNCNAGGDLVEASCVANSNFDHWFRYTATCTGLVTVDTEGSAQSDTVLSVYAACGGAELACDDDSGTGYLARVQFPAVAGAHYWIRLASYGTGCGGYNLNISCSPSCALNCPGGGVPEGEPGCGPGYTDAYNGGCNSAPPVFQPIVPGQTVCGTSGTWVEGTNSVRDTDWYEVVTTQPLSLTWTVTAEFPVRAFVLDGNCGCANPTVIGSVAAAPCSVASVTTGCLPPGRYWLWVGPQGFSGVTCGADYIATLTAAACALTPGERCESALPIPSLPFLANGTTCGRTDDYDQACPFTGSTSPDVVYAYAATADGHIDIALCDSAYDTKVYVYEDACPTCRTGTPIACNDDDSTVCTPGAYRSFLDCVPVQAGHTYYIVIDGYGGECGTYVLNVTADPGPTIQTCAADRTLAADAACQAVLPDLTGEVVAVDGCDPAPVVTQSPPAGTVVTLGAHVITLTVTDNDGLTATCTATCTVVDQTPPEITTCPPDRVLAAGPGNQLALPDLAAELVASDACDTNLTVTQVPPAGTLVGPGVTTVTLTVTDDAGLTDTCTVAVNVLPARLTLRPDKACYAAGETVRVEIWMENVSASIVGGQFFLAYDAARLAFVAADPSHAPPPAPFDPADPFDVEVYECSPLVSPPGPCVSTPGLIDYAVGTRDQLPPFPGATGTQRMAILTFTALTNLCTETDLVTWRTHVPPTQLADFDAQPVLPITLNLQLGDATPPVLVGCPADTTAECGAVPAPAPVTATDNCDAAPVVTLSESTTPGACVGAYTLTRTWTAVDHCGNSASCTQVITVQDTTPPTFVNCPTDATVSCDAVPAPPVVTATDDCDPAPTVVFSQTSAAGPCPQSYTLTRTWTATDACGNSATCTQVLTVQDTTPPTFVDCPPDATVSCDAVPPPAAVTATDNCDPAPVVVLEETTAPLPTPGYYTLTRTWTATDACGNSATCTQVLTVQDTTPPTLVGCPSDTTASCDAVPPPPVVTATDNCDPAPAVSLSTTTAPGTCPQSYTLTRTWTATDQSGNSASCTQVITVTDTTPPTFTRPADVTRHADAGGCTLTLTLAEIGAPTGLADNCAAPAELIVQGVRSDGVTPLDAPFTLPVTTITWTVADPCGNVAPPQTQTITILPHNVLSLDVHLRGNGFSVPFDRCLTVELYRCADPTPVVLEQVVRFDTFVPGSGAQANGVTWTVPCGSYDCIRVRDRQHTLWQTASAAHFFPAGGVYVARFVADADGDDRLICGNLNGDGVIDVLDFALYALRFGETAPINLACGGSGIHADFTGDGWVDTVDFTFIQTHFLASDEPGCCGLLGTAAAPRSRVSLAELAELGLPELAAADLNGDGWVDGQDLPTAGDGVAPAPSHPHGPAKRPEQPRPTPQPPRTAR